jgi:hypothetical protein
MQQRIHYKRYSREFNLEAVRLASVEPLDRNLEMRRDSVADPPDLPGGQRPDALIL